MDVFSGAQRFRANEPQPAGTISAAPVSLPESRPLTEAKFDTRVTRAQLEQFARNNPNIKAISLIGAKEDACKGLHRLLDICKQVTSINLSKSNIVDADVVKICRNHGERLEELNLNNCFNLTNESVEAIGKYCPNLRLLGLRAWSAGCPDLDEPTYYKIWQRGTEEGLTKLFPLRKLEMLDLSETPVNAQILEWILSQNSNLRMVNITVSKELPERYVSHLRPIPLDRL